MSNSPVKTDELSDCIKRVIARFVLLKTRDDVVTLYFIIIPTEVASDRLEVVVGRENESVTDSMRTSYTLLSYPITLATVCINTASLDASLFK